jgi:cobaltochelatase CobS
MTNTTQKTDDKGRLICLECNEAFHRLDVHLRSKHQMTPEDYRAKFPGADVLSAKAKKTEGDDSAPAKPARKAKKPAVAKAAAAKAIPGYQIGVAAIAPVTGLTEYDKQFVEKHDDNFIPGKREKEQLEALAVGVQNDLPVFFVGPAGCGKTTAGRVLSAAVGAPFRRLNFHGDFRVADAIGEKTVEVEAASGQAVVVWKDGVVVDAMRHGHWLFLDELDACPASILFMLQSLLEPERTITLPTGERVKAHKNFRLMAAANTTGRGDDSGLYSGTNLLNEAFLDRWAIVVKATYPDNDTEAQILSDKTGLAKAEARKMVNVAEAVRKGAANEQLYCTFSTRRLLVWAELSMKFGSMNKAANYAVLNKRSEEDLAVVSGLIQRMIGSDA